MNNYHVTIACTFIIVFSLFLPLNLYAGDDRDISLFYALLPGGTHFYDGDIREGLAFSLSEISFFTAGLVSNNRLNRHDGRELNISLLLAGQVYAVDKWSYFQKKQLILKKEYPDYVSVIRFDSTPVKKLFLAPFNPRTVFSPLVLFFAALGVIDGIIAYPRHNIKNSDISEITAVDQEMSRRVGTCYYEGAAFAVSYGAAVSEEMMFRGLILPILDQKLGESWGLFITSLTFGLLHLLNYDIDKPVYFVSQATLAGLVFGIHVQNNDYKISKPIAAHFWYNFISMTTTWLINPKENPLGLELQFEF